MKNYYYFTYLDKKDDTACQSPYFTNAEKARGEKSIVKDVLNGYDISKTMKIPANQIEEGATIV